MLIIAGYVIMDPERRDDYVAAFADMVARARTAPGCLDVAITADPLDAGRVNVYERWESKDALERWPTLPTPTSSSTTTCCSGMRRTSARRSTDVEDRWIRGPRRVVGTWPRC